MNITNWSHAPLRVAFGDRNYNTINPDDCRHPKGTDVIVSEIFNDGWCSIAFVWYKGDTTISLAFRWNLTEEYVDAISGSSQMEIEEDICVGFPVARGRYPVWCIIPRTSLVDSALLNKLEAKLTEYNKQNNTDYSYPKDAK